MKEIEIDAYAKVNLSLDVLYRREDGYHEINTIMQQINLKDTLVISDLKEGIVIECSHPEVPLDSSNLVYKAWMGLKEKFSIHKGAHIVINKNIPVAAGLAGGSTDAAATLKGLNELWGLNLTEEELMDIGVTIGADVPFCIMGGTALAQGIGEKLTRLSSFSRKLVLVANPGIPVSSAHVYKNLRLERLSERPDTDRLIRSIEEDDLSFLAQNMVNVLEQVTLEEYSIIKDIKEQMKRLGALGSLMSGSGSTVFGIFDNMETLERCKNEMENNVKVLISTKTI